MSMFSVVRHHKRYDVILVEVEKMTRNEAAKNLLNMRRYKREVTSSQEAAIQALKTAGILMGNGKVAEPYEKLLKSNH